MSLLVPANRIVQIGDLQRFLLPRKPAVLGSRIVTLGDSITAGATATTSDGSGGRLQLGGWPAQLAGKHPDMYYLVHNAGVGGDVIGGIGHVAADVSAGATSVTIIVDRGTRPHNTSIGVYFGGWAENAVESRFPSAFASNGNKSYTLTVPALGNAYKAGDFVSWGTFARLNYDVVAYRPETVLCLLGTNDTGHLTADEAIPGLLDIGQYLRSKGIEVIFMELMPRSTYMNDVASFNDLLRYRCARQDASREGPYHLVPLYRVFAGSDGKYANPAYTSDGLHPTDAGYSLLADTVHDYVGMLPMRITQMPRAAYDTDPTNLIQNSCMRSKVAVRVTTIVGAINSSVNTFSVVDPGDINFWPSASFVCVIDRGTVNEEQILVTARGGGGGVVLSGITRGYNSTTAVSHSASAPIEAVAGGYYPYGWTDVPFFSGNIDINVEAPAADDNIVGNWATITATAGSSGNRSLRYSVTPQTVGDNLRVCARIRTTGMSGGAAATVNFLTGLYNIDLGYSITGNIDMVVMASTSTLSSVASSAFNITMVGNGGAGKVWVAEPLVQNLTALGRQF